MQVETHCPQGSAVGKSLSHEDLEVVSILGKMQKQEEQPKDTISGMTCGKRKRASDDRMRSQEKGPTKISTSEKKRSRQAVSTAKQRFPRTPQEILSMRKVTAGIDKRQMQNTDVSKGFAQKDSLRVAATLGDVNLCGSVSNSSSRVQDRGLEVMSLKRAQELLQFQEHNYLEKPLSGVWSRDELREELRYRTRLDEERRTLRKNISETAYIARIANTHAKRLCDKKGVNSSYELAQFLLCKRSATRDEYQKWRADCVRCIKASLEIKNNS